MDNNSSEIDFETVSPPQTRNPEKRVGTIRTIAVTNMVIGIVSLVYHVWSFVNIVQHSENLEDTGQSDVVIYMGLVIMCLISLIVLPVSFSLYRRVALIRGAPKVVIGACKCWRRGMACFLTFFIVSLMILVLSTGTKAHNAKIQNYMGGLLIIIAFTIYGIYTVGKLLNDMIPPNENATNIDMNNICPHPILNADLGHQ